MQLRHQIKAWGLVEILISMTIYAVAIVGITSLNARNYFMIRENELADRANKVMLSSMEYFKSPALEVQDMLITQFPSTNVTKSFYLNSDSNQIDLNSGSINKMVWAVSANNPVCNSSAVRRVYFILNDYSSDNFLLCLRVEITRKPNGFMINSIIEYEKNGKLISNNLIGYRPFTYEDEN